MSDFWFRTNTLIRQQNKTQRGLSIECGFSDRKIENQSSNDRIPDAIEAVKMAQALGTTVEYLVTGKELSDSFLETFKENMKKELIGTLTKALDIK